MSVIGFLLIVIVLVALVCDVASEVWLRRSRQEPDRQSAVVEKRVPGSPAPRDEPLPVRRAKRAALRVLESAAVSPGVAGKQTEEIVA